MTGRESDNRAMRDNDRFLWLSKKNLRKILDHLICNCKKSKLTFMIGRESDNWAVRDNDMFL